MNICVISYGYNDRCGEVEQSLVSFHTEIIDIDVTIRNKCAYTYDKSGISWNIIWKL